MNIIFASLLSFAMSAPFFKFVHSEDAGLDEQESVTKTALLPEASGLQTKGEKATKKILKWEIPFIANKGQMDAQVAFYAHIFCGTVFITNDGEMVYLLPEGQKNGERSACRVKNKAISVGNTETLEQSFSEESGICEKRESIVLRERLAGNTMPIVRGEGETATKINYFKGNVSREWISTIPGYKMLSMGEVYEGIELKLKAQGSTVEKLFYIKPGANPDKIKVCLETAERNGLKINYDGELVVTTKTGTVRFSCPVAYQIIDNKRVEVPVTYCLQKKEGTDQMSERGRHFREDEKYRWYKAVNIHRTELALVNHNTGNSDDTFIYGFRLGNFDTTKELVIDPMISSTFLGGSDDDEARSLAVNSNDNIYVLGVTMSEDFPVTEGVYTVSSSGNKDVFISKFSNDLTSLLASTYLGGANTDEAYALAIDSDDNVYVTGLTYSDDFPTTENAYDTSYSGGDVFVSKLSSDLGSLTASTYLGGSYSEEAHSLALDASGNIYITGMTSSKGFPTTEGAYDTSSAGASRDVFISKFDSDLTSLLASTFLGGSEYDGAYSLALDASENVYVTGTTQSDDFPMTTGVFDDSFNGNEDAFISKFSNDLTSLLASTYLGGYDFDGSYSLALDSSDNVYVAGYTGSTDSADFPTTADAYDPLYYGGDAFVSKFNTDLTSLLASTYLGGSDYEEAYSLALDANDNVYVTGITRSEDFPATTDVFDDSFNGNKDAFISKLSSDLTSLLASTYLGGGEDDSSKSVILDSSGYVCIAGSTYSEDFPATEGTYSTSSGYELSDAFISRFDDSLSRNGEVVTKEAANITYESATLNGMVNAEGLSTVVWFEYGTPGDSYDYTTDELSVGGYDDVSVSIGVGDLTFNTTYYYRLAAKNSIGTLYGDEMSFTTSVICDGEVVTSDQDNVEVTRYSSVPVTITVECEDGTPRDDALVIWEIVRGIENISISPESAITDDNGQAVFTIEGEKKGKAKIKFVSSDSNSKVKVKIKVTR
ncbi:MAG: hypothetical protein E3K37_13195 [Candidatus Kuenenia sp.]|nr:hypothetical protein [Candidatus Kuenenia hertensis]